jgi:hypothetical protein
VLTALSLAVTVGLQLCVFVLMLRRKLQKRFAWFFVYIVYDACESVLRLAVSHNPSAYFKVYWSTAIAGTLLTLLALRESFLSVFWHEVRFRWFRWVFWISIALAVAYGCFEAWAAPPRQASRFVVVMLDIEFAVVIVIATFGVLYAGSIKLFGILEHQRETAIIFGFTTNACLTAFGVVMRSTFGTRFKSISEWIPAIAYIIAELIWIRDLLRPERKLPQPTDETLRQMSIVIDRYVAILHRYLGRE